MTLNEGKNYEGWENWETWNLWQIQQNEEPSHRFWASLTGHICDNVEGEKERRKVLTEHLETNLSEELGMDRDNSFILESYLSMLFHEIKCEDIARAYLDQHEEDRKWQEENE